MHPDVTQGVAKGDLSERYPRGDDALCRDINRMRARFQSTGFRTQISRGQRGDNISACHSQPAVFINYFADRIGVSPTPDQILKIVGLMSMGIKMVESRRKDPESRWAGLRQNPVWHARRLRLLIKAHMGTRIKSYHLLKHIRFTRATCDRMSKLPPHEPLATPLSRVGYSADLEERMKSHLVADGSN